ncbi:MAG: hypothetical protein AB7U29_03435 [Desulfobulbus sp.]
MSNPTLTLIYSGSAAVKDGYWLRLEQDPLEDDTATATDVASLINAVFAVDPCVDDGEEIAAKVEDVQQAIALGTITVPDVVQTAAAEVLDLAICDQDADGSVQVDVKIIRSHIEEPYVLRVSGGELVQTVVVRQEVSRTFTVNEASSLTLDFPVLSGCSASWAGDAVSPTGSLPVIERTGSTLWWKGKVSGTLYATYTSQWEVATVKVFGVDGAQGEAVVRCFFHGLVEEFTPELPEPADTDASLCKEGDVYWRPDEENTEVTCYKSIYVTKRCKCSNEEVDHYQYDQVVPCPEWAPTQCPGVETTCMHLLGTEPVTEYVECTNDRDQYNSAEFYTKHCCNMSPPKSLPPCEEEKRVWRGGAKIEGGLEKYRKEYGDNVRLVAVSPNGGICGEWTIRQEIGLDCCSSVAAPEWDWDSSVQVMADNSAGAVYWSDSLGPYIVRVLGVGFFLDVRRTKKTMIASSPRITVYTGNACGTCDVTITDICGNSITGKVRAATGRWVFWYRETPQADVDGCNHGWSSEEIRYTTCYIGGLRYEEKTQWHRDPPTGNCLPTPCPTWLCDPGRTCQILWDRWVSTWEC